MTYTAHRDDRFEYVWEVMEFIEGEQCNTCAFKSDRTGYPMCVRIELELISEEPVEALDDRGSDGVVCTAYRNEEVAEREHPDQRRLF